MANAKDDLKREFPKRPRQKLKLSIPIPPTQNKAYFAGRRGMRPHAKLYMAQCKAHILKVIEETKWQHEGENVWFYIDMVFYFPDRRFRDSHNTFKVGFDGMEGTFNHNDYYFLPRVQGCYLDRDNPRVECLITPQTEASFEKFKKGPKQGR